MKGLMLIAIAIDTDRGDVGLAMRRALSIAEGMGITEGTQPQVIAKVFTTDVAAALNEPQKYLTANDYHRLGDLGFDPLALRIDVVSGEPVDALKPALHVVTD